MPQIKQPAEQLIFSFDFAQRLGAETITAIQSVTITPRGRVAQVTALSIGTQAFAGSEARLRIDGGTDGETYLVRLRVTDSAGQSHELDTEFDVLDLTWTVPDVSTTYVTLTDFVARFGIEETVRLTDEAGSGRIDKARITGALVDAQAMAEGWLAGRFSLPITPTPPLVATAILDLAMLRLHRGEAPAGVTSAGKQAILTLEALGKGTMTLPGSATPATAPADPVVYATSGRQFNSDTLAGY